MEELSRGEERFRLLAQNSSDVITVVDADGTIVYESPSMERILGYRPEDRIGKNAFQLSIVHPDDTDKRQAVLDEILEEAGAEATAEFRVRHADGSWRYVEAIFKNLLHEPSVGGIVINSRDVTERKETEEARFRLAAIVESSDDAIIGKTLDGTITSWNKGAERLYGYPAGEAIGRHISMLAPPERRDEIPEILQRLRRGEKTEHLETVRVTRDGRRLDISLTVSPIKDSAGNIVGASTIARDITERKLAEKNLRDSRDELEIILQGVADGITAQDASGHLIYANEAAARMVGYASAEELVDAPVTEVMQKFEVMDEEGRPVPLAELPGRRALRGERTPEALLRFRVVVTGEERWSVVKSTPIFDEEGEVRLAVNIFRDMTERKRIEEELARALRSKIDFLADVSHELRTPLTTIRINAEVGLEMERDCPHIKLLEEIAEGSTRMSRLVEDLLFLARSESESPPLQPRQVDVLPFLAEVAEHAETLVRQRGATIETSLPAQGRIRIDPSRIEQAVLILVDNAAKYGPKGGRVTLSSSTTDGELCISVEDRGPGISEADLLRVFERFYQGDRARTNDRSQSGTGLGLAIARTITEAHGGRIEAASRPGEGTRMTLRLPLISASQKIGQDTVVQSGGK